MRPPIDLQGLSKQFGKTVALDGVSLSVSAGETVALIGPSGCGKSTLLRCVIGLVWPDDGTVDVAGERMTPETAEAVRRRMGYVIQEGGLFPHLTARENVALVPEFVGWSPERIRERTDELAALVQLPTDALGRHPGRLSGGQRQRVGIMRALVMDPEVLLLDEPLGALDPMVRADLQRDLRDIFRRLQKTTLLVTHDLSEAEYFAHRIVLMRSGQTIQEGSLKTFRDKPADAFVTAFVEAQESRPG
ncbi:MAG: ATP-binding cassette domain-containing protein [Bacteroidota bacterium]